MKLNTENRNYPRATSQIALVYSVNQTLEKTSGYTRDFSATGISFMVTEEIRPGSMINLELSLPDLDKKINTRATVIRNWIEDEINYISVQFFDINYEDFIILLDYSLTFCIEE